MRQIRRAEAGDIGAVLQMQRDWAQEIDAVLQFGFDEEAAEDRAKMYLQSGLAFVLEVDEKVVGFISGLVQPYPLNPTVAVFTVTHWYVLPDHRKEGHSLLKTVEDQLRQDLAADKIIALALDSSLRESIEHTFQRLGYRLLSTEWVKDLT